MDNVKDDSYYLKKVIDDLEFLIKQTNGKAIEQIQNNQLLIDSIMFRLIQISENADKLSERIKTENKSIPWRAIKGMRNRIVHDYGYVDMTVVFDTVTISIPELYSQLKDLF